MYVENIDSTEDPQADINGVEEMPDLQRALVASEHETNYEENNARKV